MYLCRILDAGRNLQVEGLSVSATVNVKAEVNNMILRKCKIETLTFNGTVDAAVIDRCFITNLLTLSSYIKDRQACL